jgi:putative transposase
MCIADRKTGWLGNIAHLRFREISVHASFRYGLCCPVYCLMPAHMHVLWLGLLEEADQRTAMKFLRTQLASVLKEPGVELQKQGYDHVLRDDERKSDGLCALVEYIARNPERKQLVPPDGYRQYPFTGCVMPGYPDLTPFQKDYWELLDRLGSQLRRNRMFRGETT